MLLMTISNTNKPWELMDVIAEKKNDVLKELKK